MKADPWGTLTVPYGVINNVLRSRGELTFSEKWWPTYPIRLEVRYAWYTDKTPMPILIIIERTGRYPPDLITRWLDGSRREWEQSLFQTLRSRVFPDPCDDVATIGLPAARAEHTVLQLIDGSGEIVKNWPVEFSSPQTRRSTLEMGDVPSGHYTLTWIGNDGTLSSVRLERR